MADVAGASRRVVGDTSGPRNNNNNLLKNAESDWLIQFGAAIRLVIRIKEFPALDLPLPDSPSNS